MVMGAAIHMGSAFQNVARQSLLRAGLPDTVAGQSIDRQCSSGMMAVSIVLSFAVLENSSSSFKHNRNKLFDF